MTRRVPCLLAIPCLVLLIAPFAERASAQVWVDGSDGRLPSFVDPQYAGTSTYRPVPLPRPVPPPAEYRRVWVEPVYRIVCKRVWIEPVIRVEYDRVWVHERHGWVETVTWEGGVQIIRREWKCLSPGYWTTQRREVVVSPGRWDIVEQRELVRPGYWTMVRM